MADTTGLAANLMAEAQNYVLNIIPHALAGDIFSIGIILFLALIVFLVVFKITSWVFGLIKRAFLSIFILASLALFEFSIWQKIDVQEPDLIILTVATVGTIIGVIALLVSLIALHRHSQEKKVFEERLKAEIEETKAPGFEPTTLQMPRALTTQALKDQLKSERSLLAVLSYVIIAQFGIFSSKTLPAPGVEIGIAFLIIFYIGAFVFLKTSYTHYDKGVKHLIVASVFGFALSLMLAHFWISIPLETLLSLGYFKTDALVAFVTGLAVSLLMGSK